MSIPVYTSLQETLAGVQSLNTLDLPEALRGTFISLRTCPVQVEMLVMLGEFAYIHREALPAYVLEVLAGVMVFCTSHGFWGLQENQRGGLIVQAFMQTLGLPHPLASVGGDYPAPEALPQPLGKLLPDTPPAAFVPVV